MSAGPSQTQLSDQVFPNPQPFSRLCSTPLCGKRSAVLMRRESGWHLPHSHKLGAPGTTASSACAKEITNQVYHYPGRLRATRSFGIAVLNSIMSRAISSLVAFKSDEFELNASVFRAAMSSCTKFASMA